MLRSLSLTIDTTHVRLRLSSERDKRGIEGKSSNPVMRITLTLIKNHLIFSALDQNLLPDIVSAIGLVGL